MPGIRDALKKARLLEEGKNLNEEGEQHSYNGSSEKQFAIKIHSELLGEDIWLLSNKGMGKEIDDDLVNYLPHEIKHLVKLKATPEELKKLYLIKEIFPGSEIFWN